MKLKKVLIGIVESVLVVAILVGVAMVGFRVYYYFKDKSGVDDTSDLRERVEDEYLDEDLDGKVDDNSSFENQFDGMSKEGKRQVARDLISELREKYSNEDVVGYVVLDGYDIEYPVMYGETNDEYIKSSPYGGYDYNGSIFLDCGNHPDFSDSRNVIYGHNMINGSMFGSLKLHYLGDLEGKTFTLYTENGIGVYDVLCSVSVNPYGENWCLFPGYEYEKDMRGKGYSDEEIKNSMIDLKMSEFFENARNASIAWNDEVEYSTESKIVTLMTCYGDGSSRIGVVGVLRDEK